LNLYEVLNVSPESNFDDIVRAYRREALYWHPTKHGGNRDATEKFRKVNIAYEVLSDRELKQKYDVNKRLDTTFKPTDAGDMFTKVFGPNYDVTDDTIVERMRIKQDPPVVTEFYCTLEQIYRGHKKVFEVTKNIFGDEDDKVKDKVKKRIEINIKQGWKSGTKIIFEREGDEHVGRIPADLVFIMKEAPHIYLTREGNNVVYHANVTLKEALKGVRVKVPLLDGTDKVVTIGKVIHPSYTHKLDGCGMPDSHGGFGDLLIRFFVRFPEKLNDEQRDNVSKMFDDKKYDFVWK